MTDLPEPDYGDGQDAYARFREGQEAEHLLTQEHRRADTLMEHRPARPDPKPPKREKRGQTPPLIAWKLTVLERDQGCYHTNPAECEPPFEAHHVVPQQKLRRDGRTEALWNPLSGMGVCRKHHWQHHHRTRPILLDEIPPVVVAFFREAGYSWYLDKHYPARDIEL